jgi:hypothetical protein
MKKVYGLLVALIFGAAMMVQAAPMAKPVKNNIVATTSYSEVANGTQQMHRRVIHHRHRRVIHHRRYHRRAPHATVIIRH